MAEAFDMIQLNGLPAQGNGQWVLHDSGAANTSGGAMATSLKDDISRSMAWIKGSLSLSSTGERLASVGQKQGPNSVRDLFTDLMAYVLLFLGSLDQRSPSLSEVREKVKNFIADQEKRAKGGEAPWESYLEARFAVLSWVDELVLTSTWANRGQWQHLMLPYHGTLNAGEEFFERLERLPSDAREVREVYYLCLKLGFLGQYALDEGSNQIGKLRHGLYRQLSGAPNDIRQSYPRLFPEAYRKPPEVKRSTGPRVHPLWFGLVAFVVVALFATYWFVLRSETNRLLARLEAPSPTPAPVDWTRSLIEELRKRKFEVEESSRGVVVTLPGLLFEVSSSKLSGDGEKRIGELGLILKQHALERRVAVEGHASRERGTLDETNQRLAEDRAKNAADVLMTNGFPRDKVTWKGLGSSSPVTSNDTEEGRRKNRRIEIIIDKATK